MLRMSAMKLITEQCYDSYHHIVAGSKKYKLIHNNIPIGYMSTRPFNGQIGIIRLDSNYRGIGIGHQLLKAAYDDIISDDRATNMWAVTMKDHPFWRNIPGMQWTEPAHHSVTGNGYSVSLTDKEFKKWIHGKSNNADIIREPTKLNNW